MRTGISFRDEVACDRTRQRSIDPQTNVGVRRMLRIRSMNVLKVHSASCASLSQLLRRSQLLLKTSQG